MTNLNLTNACKITSDKQERNFLAESKNILEDSKIDSINQQIKESKI
jgi:hypothetical protein